MNSNTALGLLLTHKEGETPTTKLITQTQRAHPFTLSKSNTHSNHELPWRLLVLGIICLPKLASLSGLVAPRASHSMRLGASGRALSWCSQRAARRGALSHLTSPNPCRFSSPCMSERCSLKTPHGGGPAGSSASLHLKVNQTTRSLYRSSSSFSFENLARCCCFAVNIYYCSPQARGAVVARSALLCSLGLCVSNNRVVNIYGRRSPRARCIWTDSPTFAPTWAAAAAEHDSKPQN